MFLLKPKFLNFINKAIKPQSQLLNKFKTYDEIPGPKTYPFIGSLLSIKDFGGEFNLLEFRNFQHELQAKYGNIVKWEMMNEKNVYLYDPEYIRQAYKNDGNAPERSIIPPLIELHKKLGIRSTLINSQGDRWRSLRSLGNPCMARPKTIYSYIGNQNEVANDFIQFISKKFNGQDNVLTFEKFDVLLRLLALEYISVVVFDKRLNCVDEENRLPDVTDLVMAIETFFVQVGRLLFSPPIWKLVPTKDWTIFENAGRFIYKVAGDYIHNAQKNIETSEKKTVLKEFLMRKEKYGLDINDVIAIMTDFLIAGVDTTATAIYYLMYELGTNPDVQEKLYQEIKQVVNEDENITEEHVEKFKYLKCVIKESMRLHSTVPANSRILSEDTVINDYLIPKGTTVVFCNSYITKTEKFFPNPDKFDPERWIRDEQEIHPFSTLSFGFGARMCIGRRIAEQEMYLTLVKLIQNFRVEYIGKEPGLRIGLIASPDRYLNLKLHKRN